MAIVDVGLAQSQEVRTIEVLATINAAGTEWTVSPAYASAKNRVYIITGNASATLSTARATQLVGTEAIGNSSSYIPQTARVFYTNGTAATDLISELVSGLVTYIGTPPAVADAAKAYAFVVGGTGGSEVISAELTVYRQAATAGLLPAMVLTANGVSLGNRIKDATATMRVTYSANQLNICQGVVFGNFTIPDGDSGTFGTAPAANDLAKLVIKVR
jgi:hypothetical protein